jgi:hypothetical protein
MLGIILFPVVILAIEAPYLISATALSDSSISLAWRNNDAAATGTIVMRRLLSESSYKTVDSIKSETQVTYITYTDVNGLMPETAYSYQLRAFNQNAVSDTSNSLSAVTLSLTPVFIKPSVTIVWDYDTSRFPIINIFDSSTSETGYRIYRDKEFSGTFSEIAYHPSTVPNKKEVIQILDTGISLNNWYSYKISAIKGDSSLVAYCTTFTFRSIKSKNAVILNKIRSIPLSVDSGWSAKAGDSIIVKEKSAPEGKFTVLNVKDPKNPKFDGYTDSATLLKYPVGTLIPVFLRYGTNDNYGNAYLIKAKNNVLMLNKQTYGNAIYRFKISDDSLDLVDSIKVSSIVGGGAYFSEVKIINDSLFSTTTMSSDNAIRPSYTYYYTIFEIWSEIVRPLLTTDAGGSSIYGVVNCSSSILGAINNQILIINQISSRGDVIEKAIIGDVFGNHIVRFNRHEPYTNAYFTGIGLLNGNNLYTHRINRIGLSVQLAEYHLDLYFANPWDARGYETAVANNAVYIDSTHKQNNLKNIFVDSVQKAVYLVFDDALTVLAYEFTPAIGVKLRGQESKQNGGVTIIPQRTGRGVTFLLPSSSLNSRIEIFDIGGRVIDRLALSRSNAVLWQPKVRLGGCYIAVCRIGGKKYCERFFMR